MPVRKVYIEQHSPNITLFYLVLDKFSLWLSELASNSQSFCVSILSEEISGLYHYTTIAYFIAFQNHLINLILLFLFSKERRRKSKRFVFVCCLFVEARSPSVGLVGLELDQASLKFIDDPLVSSVS